MTIKRTNSVSCQYIESKPNIGPKPSSNRGPLIRLAFITLCCTVIGSTFAISSASAQLPKFDKLNPFNKGPKIPKINANMMRAVVNTPQIGEYTSIGGNSAVPIHGVGLVVGLPGTGDDPPVSTFRSQLVREMKRREVKDIKKILRSPNTALVVLKAYLPPLVQKGDTFDVEVRIPGSSEATSLNGGWLLSTYLSEQAPVPGQGIKMGHVLGTAKGPILVSSDGDDAEVRAGVLKRGKILGGGRSFKERNMNMYLRNDFRSVRNAKRLADKIGARFYDYDEYSIRQSMASAKDDTKIDLKIMPQYKNNHARYISVVRRIAFREKPVARNVRMTKLKDRLLNPAQSEAAALELEAIGLDAVPTLQAGLKSNIMEVRFHSAVALTYIGRADGLEVLANAVEKERAFRVYALAAMAAIEDSESHFQLRNLMSRSDISSAEVRYGAFRALSTLDKKDPFIRPENMNDQFKLHVLDTHGPEMTHLTTRKQAEVVLFGKNQALKTPLVLRAGKKILLKAVTGSDTVKITNFYLPEREQQREVSTKLADIIRAVVDMGASYPDVAKMLTEADQQNCLPGRLEINATPKVGLYYQRPLPQTASSTAKPKKVRVGSTNYVPNMFAEQRDFSKKPTIIKRTNANSDKDSESGVTTAEGEEEISSDDEETKIETESESKPKSRFGIPNLLNRK